MSVVAHTGIEAFSAYRVSYTRKRDWKPRTYAAVFKTTTYVHEFKAIFCIYPTLYTEKTSIYVWAAVPILGWPRKLIRPWKFIKIISK